MPLKFGHPRPIFTVQNVVDGLAIKRDMLKRSVARMAAGKEMECSIDRISTNYIYMKRNVGSKTLKN